MMRFPVCISYLNTPLDPSVWLSWFYLSKVSISSLTDLTHPQVKFKIVTFCLTFFICQWNKFQCAVLKTYHFAVSLTKLILFPFPKTIATRSSYVFVHVDVGSRICQLEENLILQWRPKRFKTPLLILFVSFKVTF